MPCSTWLAWICHALSNLEDSKLARKLWCDCLLELFCWFLVGGFPAALNDSNTRGILATNVNVGATSVVQKYLDCMYSLSSIQHTQEICVNLFHQIAEFVYLDSDHLAPKAQHPDQQHWDFIRHAHRKAWIPIFAFVVKRCPISFSGTSFPTKTAKVRDGTGASTKWSKSFLYWQNMSIKYTLKIGFLCYAMATMSPIFSVRGSKSHAFFRYPLQITI